MRETEPLVRPSTVRQYTGPYRVTLLETVPTGVEHMGAVEMGLEPVLQRVAEKTDTMACIHQVIQVASRLATEDCKGETLFAFDRRQHVNEAMGDLTDEGGRVLLGAGYEIKVERIMWLSIYEAAGRPELFREWEPEWDDHDTIIAAYNARFGNV